MLAEIEVKQMAIGDTLTDGAFTLRRVCDRDYVLRHANSTERACWGTADEIYADYLQSREIGKLRPALDERW